MNFLRTRPRGGFFVGEMNERELDEYLDQIDALDERLECRRFGRGLQRIDEQLRDETGCRVPGCYCKAPILEEY